MSVAVGAVRPQYGGTLRIEALATVRGLDPGAAAVDPGEAALASRIRPLIFETLVGINPAGGLRPLLATSWESDANGARWRFTLRSRVTLHDGTALDPGQVAASLRSSAKGWTVATDGDAVIVTPPRPTPALAWELAEGRHSVAVRRSAADMLGTGPFRIERVDASRVSLRAHDGYWAGRPFVDGIRVEMGRTLSTQLSDLELARADVIEVQPIDARRLTQRGLHVAAGRPLDLFLLGFEPARATRAGEPVRRALAAALDRSAMCEVLLQGWAEPAESFLPSWLSGYPAALVSRGRSESLRPPVSTLPREQRTVALRIDPSDALARSIAERIAVDARQAGVDVIVQAPTGLAPRPDVRLIRVKVEATSPDRAIAHLMTALGSRAVALATSEPPPSPGAPIDAVLRFERAGLETFVVVPVVRVAELYGFGETVESWDARPVSAIGEWNAAGLWLRSRSQAARAKP